jgi:hypothetical protein
MEPYDAEFRGEVLAACDTNEERRLIALRFNVSESWLRRIQQQRRETGQLAPKKAAPRQPKWHAWAAEFGAGVGEQRQTCSDARCNRWQNDRNDPVARDVARRHEPKFWSDGEQSRAGE